jgi:hypothetical protein
MIRVISQIIYRVHGEWQFWKSRSRNSLLYGNESYYCAHQILPTKPVQINLDLTFLPSYKYLGSFEMRWWRRMGKISWADRVTNEEVLHRVKEERGILHTIRKRKDTWIGHILRRNCVLKHVVEGKIQ